MNMSLGMTVAHTPTLHFAGLSDQSHQYQTIFRKCDRLDFILVHQNVVKRQGSPHSCCVTAFPALPDAPPNLTLVYIVPLFHYGQEGWA